jgi:hypothetical protein
MLWFYESFFPVVWILFLVYWQIKDRCVPISAPLKSGLTNLRS